MRRLVSTTVAAGVMLCAGAASLAAQNAGGAPLAAPNANAPRDQARNAAAARDQRYQIGVLERVLEQAVEHGAARTRERMQAVLPPPEMLLSPNPRGPGFP